MKKTAFACILGVAAAFTSAYAHKDHEKPVPSVEAQAKAYPLPFCVVSGDKLEDGDMGPPIDYVHKEEGKPDRVVRLCCKGCVRDFKKDPAKYLKMIDDAAAGKKVEAPDAQHGHE